MASQTKRQLREYTAHTDYVAKTAAHDKQMEYLMTAEISGKPVKYLQLKAIDDTARRVDQSSCQKPAKSSGRQSGQ